MDLNIYFARIEILRVFMVLFFFFHLMFISTNSVTSTKEIDKMFSIAVTKSSLYKLSRTGPKAELFGKSKEIF